MMGLDEDAETQEEQEDALLGAYQDAQLQQGAGTTAPQQDALSAKTYQTLAVLMERQNEIKAIRIAYHIQQRVAGADKKKKMQVPARLKTALKNEENLAKTWVINHQRLKFLLELLWSIVKYAEEKSLVKYESSIQLLMHMFLHEMIEISVQPFNELNGEGKLKSFLETLPRLVRLCSVANKWKIARAGLLLIAQIQHLVAERPDMLQLLGEICTSLNEVVIEHANSIIQREAMKRLATNFDELRSASIQTFKKRKDLIAMSTILEIGDEGPLRAKSRKQRNPAKAAKGAAAPRAGDTGGGGSTR